MSSQDKYEGYKILLEERLSEKRYQHSLGVADTAAKLATFHSQDIEKAYLAGLMHDYAKNLDDDELLEIATENQLLSDAVEVYVPELLHGVVAAFLLKRDGIITDEEILQAITWHTTGHQEMTPLDAIVYIADYIEPNRNFPNIDALRTVSYRSLEFGLLQCLDNTLAYLLTKGAIIHPFSIQARNVAITRVNKRNYN